MEILTTKEHYTTSMQKISWWRKLFPGVFFYIPMGAIVWRAAKLAKANQYDYAAWSKSSLDTLRILERVGVRFNIENLDMFDSAGHPGKKVASTNKKGTPGELLIHRSSRALWRISDDGKRIEPAFSDDIITIGDEDE